MNSILKNIRRVKTLLTALILMAFVSAIIVEVQAGLVSSSLTGAASSNTNAVPHATTQNYVGVVSPVFIAASTIPTIQLTLHCNAASTAPQLAWFGTSVDNANWTSNAFAIQITPAGTAGATTNYVVPAAFRTPFIRFENLSNTNATTPDLTNIVFNVFVPTGI